MEHKDQKPSIDLHPTVCNLCGGRVIYTSNAAVYYGKTYGSGYCYLCTECGAYTGTHEPHPEEALGLLADARMRKGKKMCHALFDPWWQTAEKKRTERQKMYAWLAKQLDIPVVDSHIGYFDLEQLRKVYKILKGIENKQKKYDKNGNIYFE